MPSAPLVPKTSRVAAFGVAVNAKNEMFGSVPWAASSLVTLSSGSSSATSAPSRSESLSRMSRLSAGSSASMSESVSLIFLWVSPDWEEWASSMTTANVLPEVRVSSQM